MADLSENALAEALAARTDAKYLYVAPGLDEMVAYRILKPPVSRAELEKAGVKKKYLDAYDPAPAGPLVNKLEVVVDPHRAIGEWEIR